MLSRRQDTFTVMDRLFDDMLGSSFGLSRPFRNVEVHQTVEDVVFVAEVPGMKREDIDITLENHVLTLKGTRKGNGVRSARSFAEAFTLDTTLDEEKLTAELADGILTVRIPKREAAKPRKVEIKVLDAPKS
jgi:HSP20 family protein